MLLHFFTGRHHQVGHFVGHNHDEGEMLGNFGPFFVRFRLNPLPQFFIAKLIENADMTHTGTSQQSVAFFHFINGPTQNGLGLFHVGNHRVHQVRQAFVRAKFDHFGVDHQHFDFVGSTGHDHRKNDGV